MTSVSGAPPPLDFIAYTPAAETASVYAAWTRDSVGDAGELRFVAAANLHVTLVFRGRGSSSRSRDPLNGLRDANGAKCEEGQWRQEALSGEWITQ